jgi:hypothetical protein
MAMIHRTVTVAAGSRSLVELATVKAELGITGSGSDTKLNRLILAASSMLAGPEGLNREPWLQTYLEHLPGRGGHYLILSRWPIQSVASVTRGTTDSPDTVTASDYEVAGNAWRDRLYKKTGWTLDRLDTPHDSTVTDGPLPAYNATYTAGWVMPDLVTEWSAGASVAASAWFKSTDADEPFIFQADAVGGTTDAAEPTWPTVAAGTVTDNGITWTAYDQQLPKSVEEAAILLVAGWFSGDSSIPSGIKSEAHDGSRIEYLAPDVVTPLSAAVRALVSPYRSASF